MAFGSSSRNTGASSSNPAGEGRILPLEVNGLYILLTDQGVADKWHWVLYLHRAMSRGWTLHCTRPTGFWFFEQRTSETVIFSLSVVTAIKIAVMSPSMQEALRDRVAEVPLEDTQRFGTLTCRTWLLRAVDELDSEGYISLKHGSRVEDVEHEAKDAAAIAALTREATVQHSIYSIV